MFCKAVYMPDTSVQRTHTSFVKPKIAEVRCMEINLDFWELA